MILYLDTSSLLKLYLREERTEAVKTLLDKADGVATSLIAYVETRSGLARARRGGRLGAGEHDASRRAFETDWATFAATDVTEPLVRLAGDLAEKHALRGFDAIHLASALTLQRELGEQITFSASDDRLMSAAQAEGLTAAV